MKILIPALALAGLAASAASAAPAPQGAKDQLFADWTKACAKEGKASIGGVRAGIPAAAEMTDAQILRLAFDDFYTASQAELKEAVALMKGEDLLPNEALFLCFAELRLKMTRYVSRNFFFEMPSVVRVTAGLSEGVTSSPAPNPM